MKKINFWLNSLLIFFCLNSVKAQVTAQEQSAYDTIFSKLQSLKKLNGGLFYDYVPHLTNFDWYYTKSDSFCLAGVQKDVYNELFWMQLKQGLIPNLIDPVVHEGNQANFQIANPRKHALQIMHARYAGLAPTCLTANLLDTVGGFLIDHYPRPREPYDYDTLLFISPVSQIEMGNEFTLTLNPTEFVGNLFNELPKVYVDWGKGSGWQLLAWNDSLKQVFNDKLEHTVLFKLSYANNKNFYAKTKVQCLNISLPTIVDSPPKYCVFSENYLYPIDGTISYTYNERVVQYAGRARINVKFGRTNSTVAIDGTTGNKIGKLVKPFIFSEGVDFGFTGYANGPNTTGQCGTLGWQTLYKNLYFYQDDDDKLHLIDFNNTNELTKFSGTHGFEYPFRNISAFIDSLSNLGYDIVYVDYDNGGDYIQNIAAALTGVIQKVNDCKVGCEELVLVGASMGGQACRYALTYMEKMNIPHNVKEMVAFDSPNLGANIPIGIQYSFEWLAGKSGSGILSKRLRPFKGVLSEKLDRPAAQQLLLKHHLGPNGNASILRFNFMNELMFLDADGYPNKCKLSAFVNGSGYGVGQDLITESSTLLKFKLYLQDLAFASIKVAWKAKKFGSVIQYMLTSALYSIIPPNHFTTTAYADNGLAGKLISVSQHNQEAPKGYASNGNGAYDHIPGAKNSLLGDALWTLENSANPENRPLASKIIQIPSGKFICFIPTFSSLGMKAPYDSPTYNTASLFSTDANFKNYSSVNLSTVNQYSPFSYLYMPKLNQMHVEAFTSKDANINYKEANAEAFLDHGRYISQVYNLPSTIASGQTYNFNPFVQNYTLQNVTILSGGNVSINRSLNGAFGNLPIQTAKNIRVNVCEQLRMTNGSIIQIGVSNQQVGEIHILNGAKLILEPGSKFYINNGSSLIIEAGGELIYNGGDLYIDGESSMIDIKGNLTLGAGSVFKPTISVPTTNTGFLRFSAPAVFGVNSMLNGSVLNFDYSKQIKGFANSRIELMGKNSNDVILDIAQPTLIANQSLSGFFIKNAKVTYTGQAELKILCKTRAINTNFDGYDFGGTFNPYAIGVVASGAGQYSPVGYPVSTIFNGDFENCTFNYLKNGLVANNSVGNNPINLLNCSFNSCSVGALSIYGLSANIKGCAANGNACVGMGFSAIANNVLIESSNINNNNGSGITIFGSPTSNLQLKKTVIRANYGSGIEVFDATTVKLRCSEISYNTVGVSLGLNSSLDMSVDNLNGYNKFDYNVGEAILLNDAASINILNGYNSFNKNTLQSTQYFINGSILTQNCGQNLVSFNFSNNKWNNYTSNYNVIMGSKIYTSSNNTTCPLYPFGIISNAPLTTLPDCGVMDASTCNDPAVCRVIPSTVQTCTTCKNISTTSFSNTPINTAALKVVTNIDAKNTNLAVTQGAEILGANYTAVTTNEEVVLEYITNAVNEAFAKENDKSVNSSVLNAEAQKILTVIDKLINVYEPKGKTAFVNKLKLYKSHIYRINQDYINAQQTNTTLLNSNAAYNEALSRWNCYLDAERNLKLNPFLDMNVLVKACNNSNKRERMLDESIKSIIDNARNNEGLEELQTDDKLKIFPNPANESIFINVQTESEKYDLVITDLQGRVILENRDVIQKNYVVDLTSFSKGVYLVKVIMNDNVEVKKLVVD